MKNKLKDLNDALLVELETLQDEESFKDDDGNIDMAKAELAIKRATAVTDVAGRIMELSRIQLDAVKTANSMGIALNMPETLGIEEVKHGDARKALGAPRY